MEKITLVYFYIIELVSIFEENNIRCHDGTVVNTDASQQECPGSNPSVDQCRAEFACSSFAVHFLSQRHVY